MVKRRARERKLAHKNCYERIAIVGPEILCNPAKSGRSVHACTCCGVYDSMHACGCYHMFFPTAQVTLLPAPEPAIEWAFVPLRLPALGAVQTVTVRIACRTHYVVDVSADGDAAAVAYQFADDDDLRALPDVDHGTRSAVGPDGIVPGTDRAERFLFWPMGIDNAGAMRQWGNHATAFVGRRHFDDADLIERRFEMSCGGQASFARPK